MADRSYVAEILKKLSRELGFKVNIEKRFGRVGQIIFPGGKKFYFKGTSFDVNSFGAAEIATDKDYSKMFMEKMGYTVPEGAAFFSDAWCKVCGTKNNISAALRYAAKIKFPVIVKPNGRTHGIGVSKAYDVAGLKRILSRLFKTDKIVLVEKFIEGRDYRIVVLGDNAPIAYERRPLSVLGDGKRTVAELFARKAATLKKLGRAVNVEINDPRIAERLRHFHIKTTSILPAGRDLAILDNANMSSGGEGVDVSEVIHADYKQLAVSLTAGMGLSLAGVDIITALDIGKPMSRKPVVLEINASPGLAHYKTLNKEAAKRVRKLYKSIILKLKERI